MPSPRFTIRVGYQYGRPIALKDLTASLNSVAAQYQTAQKRTATALQESKAELYITRIREGSILAELSPYVGIAGLVLIENANTIAEFAGNLKTGVDFFLGRVKRWPGGDKKAAQNISRMVEPVAKDNAAQININAPIGNNSPVNVTINYLAAREIKRTSKIYIQSLDAPGTNDFDDIELLWYQARNDTAKKAGDRAIVPRLSDKPVKVMFAHDAIKAQMLRDETNPFKRSYQVDLVADFKGRQPTLYRVVRIRSSHPSS